ncbi:MAG: Sua5/YciO/YrdC/YwlC family protein [Campylobacterota bacterium]|nr:Sua5/YciO/YrdC/YwlC family protein [Campylobacterota bacterium]
MPTILLQTDTTVGFLSQNSQKLFEIKSRPQTKPFLKVYNSLKDFKNNFNRVPTSAKKLFRRSKKTTFVIKNQAYRISKLSLDSQLIRDMRWQYSTSANESGKSFNRQFCEDKSDIIIENKDGLSEQSSSTILKINNQKTGRLR